MKRFLTILLMTVAFAMNVSVVNAQNSGKWGPNDAWDFSLNTGWGNGVFIGNNCDFQNYQFFYTTDKSDPTTESTEVTTWGPQLENMQNVTTLKFLIIGKNGYNNNYNHIFEFSIDVAKNVCTLVTGGSDDPTPTLGPQAPTSVVIYHPLSTTEAHEVSNLNNYVSITGAESGATIYFTTDGSDPRNSSTRKIYDSNNATSDNNIMADINDANYTNIESVTVKAVAYKNGQYSDVTSPQQYTKGTAPTKIGPDSQNTGNIKIETSTGSTFVCYKKTASGTWYNTRDGNPSISVQSSDMPIYALAAVLNCLLSDIVTYGATEPTAKPTITFNANAGKVTDMSADDVDASHIYYTTDGNDPTTSSSTWASAQSNGVELSPNATIKVMAQADGKSKSQVVSFTNSNLPTINCNDNAITYSNTEGYTLMYSTDGNHYNTNEITSISQNTTIYLKATNSNGVTVLTNKTCTYVAPKPTKPEIIIYGHYIYNSEPSVYIQIKASKPEDKIHYSTNNGAYYSEHTGTCGFYVAAKDIHDSSYTVMAYATNNDGTSDTETKTFNKTTTPTYFINGTTLTINSPSNCSDIAYKLDNGEWTKKSLTNNQVTISGLSSSSLLSFRVVKDNNTDLYSDVVTNLAAPEISIESYNFNSINGGYVYFKIEDATEKAKIYYSTNGSNYSEYSSRLALYASNQPTNGYTLYSKAELNGQQSTPTSTTFTLTDAPAVSLNGATLSIPSEYNGFVYKVGEYWNGAIGQTSVTFSPPAPGTTIKVRAYKTGNLFSNEVTYTVPLTTPTATLDDNFIKLENGDPDFEDHFQITGEAGNEVHYTFKYAETDLSGNPTGVYTTIVDGGTGTVTLDENGQGTISNNLTDEPVVFNSSRPLILEVYATKDGKTSAINTYEFVQSAKANPIEDENSVSFEAMDGDGTVSNLKYYYYCFDYTQNTFVWSDVKTDINFTIDDYTAATSPISITTISKESGKLKAYVPQLNLHNFVKPDAPTITNNDGTVTISTDEEGTTDYPVYLIYTTDGTDPSYTVNNEVPVATSGTNTVVVNGYTTSFTISETTTVKAYVYCKDTRKYEVPYASELATETYSYTTLTQPDAPSITYTNKKIPEITISTSETFSGNKPVYIFYTTDGSEPTIDDNTADNPNPTGMTQKYKWSGSGKISILFAVDDNMSTVKAMVYCADDDKYDCYYSSISQFMIKPEAPTITIDDEGYATITTTVTDSNGNPGTIYYTTNGNNPTTYSTVYTGTPVQLEEGTTIKAIVVCNDTQKYKTFTSKITTEKYDGLWTDWELYGKGNFNDAYFYINGTTVDVYVRTNQSNSNKKQIKIKNWTNNLDPNYVFTEPGYNDYIFDWNIDDNSCAIDKKYIGIHDKINESKYMWFIPARDSQVASYNVCTNNGEYDPETDTYTLNYYYHHSKYTDKTNITNQSDNLQLVAATLKMEGMWLGEMTESKNSETNKDQAVQNSYMPANSQYTVGLVKIDSENTNLSFTGDVCRIELDDAAAVETFFNTTSNFVGDTIQRRVIAGKETTVADDYIRFTPFGSSVSFKMLDQFTITNEGAYYIVVARQVPNGDGTYSYTGAYQYMPVYYSPASNWEEVGNGECTYQNDIIVGESFKNIEHSTYPVIVEQNTENSGWYRVKNMYLYQSGSEYSFEPTNHYWTYQGEDSGRKNVYFYISTNGETASLLHPEFYAQPLGVDYGNGEMMLIGLGDGVVETDDDGMHIKFKNNTMYDDEDSETGESYGWDGMIYEWEDCRNDGFEYNGDEINFNYHTINADGVVSEEADYLRFDLFIPTPSKTRPDAPTITSDKSTGQATITTDVRSTNNEADVYIFYTTDGTEPSISYDVSGKPKSVGKTISFDCNQYHDSRDKYDVTFDASNISTIKAMVYCKDEDKFELYYSETSILLLRPEAPKITYDDSGIGTTHVTISTDLVGTEDNPVYLIYTTDGTKPVLDQNYTVEDGVPTAISCTNTFVGGPNETEITEHIGESKTYNALVYRENEEYEFYSYSPITTQYCPVWRDWQIYGRGAWEYKQSSDMYVYNAENTTDIEIATDISKPTHKRIKIDGMIDVIRNSGDYDKEDEDDSKYKDFIFEWDMTNGDCYSEYQYTGLTEKGDENKFVMAVCIKQNSPTGYIPIVDSYLPSFNLKDSSSKTEYIEASTKTAKTFTLKMDGLWLGDMVEYGQDTEPTDDYAIQYSYMPENSHYKIGLVKIDGDNENLTFEDGKCFINLESAGKVEQFFGNSSNFVEGSVNSENNVIERHWDDSENAKGEGTNQPYVENGKNDTYKMLDQFKITEEGAYYIVAARLVPSYDENGNSCYVYSGAYRYMPVYYSPSRNWKTLSYDGMRTYRDDLAYGYNWYELYYVYFKDISDAPVYSVEVQENTKTPGLFRVKNMYHSDFMTIIENTHTMSVEEDPELNEEDYRSEITSYQGESPYRDDVYFYIDATQKDEDGNTIAELFPSEFYAQPLGVDLLNGELMLASLNEGKYIDGQIVFEDYGCIYNSDDGYAIFENSVKNETPVPGYIAKVSDLIFRNYTTNEDEDDQFKLQISTPYPLFDDTPYTTTAMNTKWKEEYEGKWKVYEKEDEEDDDEEDDDEEDRYNDYNEKYGELAIFDEEGDYYDICYTNGITEGQDHVDVTYERSLADDEEGNNNAQNIGTLVLPVDFTPSDIPGFKFYKLNDENTTEGQIKFDKIGDTETIEAHTPVVFKRIENKGNMSVKLYDRTVVKKDKSYNTVKYDEDAPSIRVGNWDVTGMYTFKAVTTESKKNKIPDGYSLYDTDLEHSYIVYNDKAKQVNGGLLLDPYRAYFHLDTSVQAPALISVFFDDEPVTGIDPTSGNEQRRGAEGSYNVAGQKVKSGYRGIVIENGKKRFVK